MMKKRMTKMIATVMILVFTFSVNVFAAEPEVPQEEGIVAQNEQYTGVYNKDYSTSYTDDWGITHRVQASVSCRATTEWEEGRAGWVVTIFFNPMSATIDGNTVSTAYYGGTSVSGSSATQEYKINNTKYILVTFTVNEWGEAWLSCSLR